MLLLAKIFGVSYSCEPLPVPQPCYQDMAALQEVAAGCMLRAGSNVGPVENNFVRTMTKPVIIGHVSLGIFTSREHT